MTAFANKNSNGRQHTMFSKIRRRFTYANVAMTLALVFAMTGGAYAAKKYLITSTKQISPKVLASLKGKAGPAGAAGANGVAGPAGPAGAAGSAGGKGETGPAGPQGEEGKAGKAGVAGKEGSPWTVGGVLPPEQTETGTWVLYAPEKAASALTAISFPIRLAKELGEKEVHYVPSGGNGTTCNGSANAPTAEPGNLCVYQGANSGFDQNVSGLAEALILTSDRFEFGANTTGAHLAVTPEAGSTSSEAYGTWAVTAPEGK